MMVGLSMWIGSLKGLAGWESTPPGLTLWRPGGSIGFDGRDNGGMLLTKASEGTAGGAETRPRADKSMSTA